MHLSQYVIIEHYTWCITHTHVHVCTQHTLGHIHAISSLSSTFTPLPLPSPHTHTHTYAHTWSHVFPLQCSYGTYGKARCYLLGQGNGHTLGHTFRVCVLVYRPLYTCMLVLSWSFFWGCAPIRTCMSCLSVPSCACVNVCERVGGAREEGGRGRERKELGRPNVSVAHSQSQTDYKLYDSVSPYAYNTLNYIPANYCSLMHTALQFLIVLSSGCR